MRRLRRNEQGIAVVEFSMVLPILLVFLALAGPLAKFGYDYMVVQRAASHGVRFASRADVNARSADGALVRRPSAGEVAAFVSNSSNGKVSSADVTVQPNPRQALPGEVITVSVDYTVSYGPLADVANTVKSVFFGGGEFLPPTPITVSAWGREE